MSKKTTKRINIFLFLLPALFLFVAILVAPIFSSVYYSFFNFSRIDASDKNFVLSETAEEKAANEGKSEAEIAKIHDEGLKTLYSDVYGILKENSTFSVEEDAKNAGTYFVSYDKGYIESLIEEQASKAANADNDQELPTPREKALSSLVDDLGLQLKTKSYYNVIFGTDELSVNNTETVIKYDIDLDFDSEKDNKIKFKVSVAEKERRLFENYIELFTNKSLYDMGKATKNAFILAALSVFIQLPLSLGLALMLGRGIKGERLYLSVYFIPVLISSVVIGALWSKIYNPSYGVLKYILDSLGFTNVLPAKGLLGDDSTALLAVFIPTIWQYVGYHMLLMYAGVKSVSPELREAAKLDGATDGQVDRYVVIPSIKQIIKVSVIFAITGSLKSYDLIKIFAGSKYDVPYNVPSLMLVKNVFGGHGGEGNAIAVILIILCFAFAILINQIFKERDIYGGKKHVKQ